MGVTAGYNSSLKFERGGEARSSPDLDFGLADDDGVFAAAGFVKESAGQRLHDLGSFVSSPAFDDPDAVAHHGINDGAGGILVKARRAVPEEGLEAIFDQADLSEELVFIMTLSAFEDELEHPDIFYQGVPDVEVAMAVVGRASDLDHGRDRGGGIVGFLFWLRHGRDDFACCFREVESADQSGDESAHCHDDKNYPTDGFHILIHCRLQ